MPKQPSLEEILDDFDREIARAPKWCNVDRGLLQRVVDECRRLEALCGEREGVSNAT